MAARDYVIHVALNCVTVCITNYYLPTSSASQLKESCNSWYMRILALVSLIQTMYGVRWPPYHSTCGYTRKFIYPVPKPLGQPLSCMGYSAVVIGQRKPT